MISYPFSLRDLCLAIEAALPATRNRSGALRRGGKKSWHQRARIEERKVRATGRFPDDAEPLWNELKKVFAQIQGDGAARVKCAYCERHLHLGIANLPDCDVDHFRPKSLYPLLAYHPRNYVLACRICNETYKRSHFPIARSRAVNSKRLAELDAEQADFVHPLDPREPRLEDLIGFEGIIAMPLANLSAREERRANAMIDALQINRRDDLRRDRTKIIAEIYRAKTEKSSDSIVPIILRSAADRFEEYTNCAQSYLKLWDNDPDDAKKLGEEAYQTLYP